MNERIEELMSTICEGQNSIQREEVENYINNLKSKIDKANEILNTLCVMKLWNDSEEEMRKIYRPIKNTSKQEVYKAIYDLRDILKEDK
jgi:uncharacterized protein YwgA